MSQRISLTSEEKQFLIENYPTLGREGCAKRLNRTTNQIKHNARTLKLKLAPINWPKIDDYLYKNYATLGSQICAENLQEPQQRIIGRVRKLGLKLSEQWTKEKDDFLYKHYPSKGAKYCAIELNETEDAVGRRTSRLKIRSSDEAKFGEENIQFLKENFSKLGIAETARLLGMGKSRIKDWANKFGLEIDTNWPPENVKFLEEFYPTHGSVYCAKELGLTRQSIQAKAKRLKIKFIVRVHRDGFRTCSKCETEKTIDLFIKDKSTKTGYKSHCKRCSNEKALKDYYKDVDASRLRSRTEAKQWRKDNPKKYKAWQKRYRSNPMVRIVDSFRKKVYQAITKGYKCAHTLEIVGLSAIELKAYLENLFLKGMTWENYGKVWEVDHIKAVANFTDLRLESQQRECFGYKNLRPLWVTTDIAHNFNDHINIGNRNKQDKKFILLKKIKL